MTIILQPGRRNGTIESPFVTTDRQNFLTVSVLIDPADLTGAGEVTFDLKVEQSADGVLWWPLGGMSCRDVAEALNTLDKLGNPNTLYLRLTEQIYRADVFRDQKFADFGGFTYELKNELDGAHYYQMALCPQIRVRSITNRNLRYGLDLGTLQKAAPPCPLGRRSASLLGTFAAAESANLTATSGSRTTTAGSLIVGQGSGWWDSAGFSLAITDDKSNTYTELFEVSASAGGSSFGRGVLSYNLAGTRGTSHEVIVTLSENTGSAIGGLEFDGVDSFDTSGTEADGSSTAPSCTVTPSTGTALVVGLMIYDGSGTTFAANVGTLGLEVDENNDRQANGTLYRVAQASGGASTTSWTLAASRTWAARSAAFTETAAGGTTHEKSYSETVGSSNPYSRLSNALRRPTDTSGASNPFSRKSDALRTYSESSASADAIARLSNALRTQSDTVAFSDTYTRLADSLRAYQESGGVADAYDRLADGNRSLAENLGSTEAYERLSDALRVYSESQGHTDTFARQSDALRAVADTLGLAEAFEYTKALALAVSELLAFTDAYSRQSDANRSLADTAGLVDAYARVADAKRAFVESSGLVEAYARLADGNRVFSESLGSTEAYSRISNALRAFSDLLGLLESVTLSVPSNTLLTDLTGYWPLDEESGTRADAHDDNDLAEVTATGFAAGKIGNAADFEADSSNGLSHDSNSDLQTGDIDFTLTAWVNLESKGSVNQIVGKRNGGSSSLEYYLRYRGSDDRYNFEVSPNGTTPVTSVSADNHGSPGTGTWDFLAVWHDAVNNTLNIQVNNGTVDSVSYSGGVHAGSAAFAIGISADGEPFDGLIDEVGFWKRVLTDDERTALYNDGDGLPYSEFGAGGETYDRTYTEILGHIDVYTRLSNALRNLLESLGELDAYSRLSDALRNITDTQGHTDTYLRLSNALRNTTDTQGYSDTYSRTSDASRVYSDSLGLLEEYSRLSDALRNFTDTLGISDTALLQLITDGVFTISVIEALGFTDVYDRLSEAQRAQSDTVGISDAYSRVSDIVRTMSDSLGLSDAYSRLSEALRNFTDSVGQLESYDRLSNALRSLTDNSGYTDAFQRLSNSLRSFTDTTGLSDTPIISTLWIRLLTDTTGLSDAFARQLTVLRAVSDTTALTDTYARQSTANRSLTENIGLSELYQRQASALRSFTDLFAFLDDTELDISFGAIIFALFLTGEIQRNPQFVGMAQRNTSNRGNAQRHIELTGEAGSGS